MTDWDCNVGERSKHLNDAFRGMNMKFVRDLGGRLR